MAETMKDLKALIEAEKQKIEDPSKETVPVAVGGVKVIVEVTKLQPAVWAALTALNPVRPNVPGDARVGFDQWTLPRGYPAERIKIDGEAVTPEMWVELVDVLEFAHRMNVTTLMWGLNVFEAAKELATLGKARAGQRSSSPANRASRRADSKAASRQK